MNTTILDYIVKTIEALFYILTGIIALLTYLSARKTILQPVKTEVFKRQVEVFSSIMEEFVSIDTYCNELTDYLRKYFKVESIMD